MAQLHTGISSAVTKWLLTKDEEQSLHSSNQRPCQLCFLKAGKEAAHCLPFSCRLKAPQSHGRVEHPTFLTRCPDVQRAGSGCWSSSAAASDFEKGHELALLGPDTSPKLHLEQRGSEKPEELPVFPSSRSHSILKLCHALSRAAMATSRGCGYTGLSAKFSNYALPVVFLQRGTRKKYYYFVFALYRQYKVQ